MRILSIAVVCLAGVFAGGCVTPMLAEATIERTKPVERAVSAVEAVSVTGSDPAVMIVHVRARLSDGAVRDYVSTAWGVSSGPCDGAPLPPSLAGATWSWSGHPGAAAVLVRLPGSNEVAREVRLEAPPPESHPAADVGHVLLFVGLLPPALAVDVALTGVGIGAGLGAAVLISPILIPVLIELHRSPMRCG
jgi:hypothetical protein